MENTCELDDFLNNLLTNLETMRKLIKKLLIITILLFMAFFCFNQVFLLEEENPLKFVKPQPNSTLESQRLFVLNMTREAYSAYVRYAWTQDVLQPVTRDAYNAFFGNESGFTIMHSISTLWVMEMRAEYEQARDWVRDSLDFEKINVDVSDTVTVYIGGLISCYALTGDRMFLEKAEEVAKILEPAYNSSTGLPSVYVDLESRAGSGTWQVLSWVTGQQLEYVYLASITKNSTIAERAHRIKKSLRKFDRPNGLYMDRLDIESGKWDSNISSLFWMGRDFYITLLHLYVQSGREDGEAIEMYKEAMDAIEQNGLVTASRTYSVYARDYHADTNSYSYWMRNDGCYLGGMFALGASEMQKSLSNNKSISSDQRWVEMDRIHRHWLLAKALTETCHQAELKTRTGLAPRLFYFNEQDDASNSRQSNTSQNVNRDYYLTPDLAETYFIMWRLTHEQKYRDYAWSMAKSLHAHCRTECGGYSSIKDVNQIPTEKSNYQTPHFIGATLKYLYLTFTDDSYLPLDQWVFNTAGNPIPVCCPHNCANTQINCN